MATKVFLGQGYPTAVAQVETFQVTADDAATTYIMTIGGQTVSVSGSGTGVNDTATAFQVALDAATHPYFSAITWTVNTDTVTGTGTVAGVPFTATASVTGGTGTIDAGTVTTTAKSNYDFMLAANWDTGTAPANGDDLIIHYNAPNICWSLTTGLTGCTLYHYEGPAKIGLNAAQFATSADGETLDSTVPEYRDTYLKLEMTECVLGKKDGPTQVTNPSTRIKVYNTITTAARMYVDSVRGVSEETGLPTCRLMAADADVDVQVNSSIGGVGLGVESGDAGVFGDIDFFAVEASSNLVVGDGTTWTNYTQTGGSSLLGNGDTSVAAVILNGGILKTRFGLTSWGIIACTINGGTATLDNGGKGDILCTTLTGNGGTCRVRGSHAITTLTPAKGFTFVDVDGSTTITNYNEIAKVHTIAWT